VLLSYPLVKVKHNVIVAPGEIDPGETITLAMQQQAMMMRDAQLDSSQEPNASVYLVQTINICIVLYCIVLYCIVLYFSNGQ